MNKTIHKIFLLVLSSFLFFLLTTGITSGDWVGKIERAGGSGGYAEKLNDLKNIFDGNGGVSAEKIKNNRSEIKTMLKKKQLVGGKYLDELLKVIAINSIYEIEPNGNIISLSITGNIPLYEKNDNLGQRHKYISVDSEKLRGVIFEGKEEVWKNNIFDMLGLTKEIENKGGILPGFYQDGQQGYAFVGKTFGYSVNKLWSLVESEELGKNIIPVETDSSLIFVGLTNEDKGLRSYSQYTTTDDQFSADNPFIVGGKIQIDSFLFNYCQKEFQNGDYNKTLDMFTKHEYEKCNLLENDFNNDGVNELILTNSKYRVSNIYYQNVENGKLIIGPIYKSDRQLIKLLQNSQNVYSSFILKDWIDTNSFKNILQNQNQMVVEGGGTGNFRKLDLTYSYESLTGPTPTYATKKIFSEGGNGYSNYKINGFYTISGQTKKGNDQEGGLLVKNSKNGNIGGIYLNEKYIGIANKAFFNQNPSDYILIPRKELGVNFKNSFIEVDFGFKNSGKSLTLKIDGKTKLIVQEGGTDKIVYSEDGLHPVVQLTGNSTSTLLSSFENVDSVGIISHYNNGGNTNKKNSVYDLKFLVPEMSNLFLFGIKTDNDSTWFQLKQILSLNGYDYNFISINDVNDKSSKNVVLKQGLNFDDNFTNDSNINQYIFHNETKQNGSSYAGINLHLRGIKYFSKDSLYLEQIKNIYFDYDKTNELYVLNDNSTEEINIKGIKLGDYDFLDGCSYEEIINNDLETCAKNISPIDVDNDDWNEWLYNNMKEIQIFNNIVKINNNGTYSINFVPIFKDSGLKFCNTFKQKIPYYQNNSGKCGDGGSGECLTDYGLVFYDSIGTYKTFTITGENKNKKSYTLIDSSMGLPFICVI